MGRRGVGAGREFPCNSMAGVCVDGVMAVEVGEAGGARLEAFGSMGLARAMMDAGAPGGASVRARPVALPRCLNPPFALPHADP